MIKNIQLSDTKARELYATGSPEFKKLLEENFDKSVLVPSIIDRIKTWADVERELGRPVEVPFSYPTNKAKRSVTAFVCIKALCECLNEGWLPNFDNKIEHKWCPYFEKVRSRWVFAGCTFTTNFVSNGFTMYFRTHELASYAGTTFIDFYKELLPE